MLLARLRVDRAEEATMNRWDAKRCFGDGKIWIGYVRLSLSSAEPINHHMPTSPRTSVLMFFGVVNMNYSTNFFNPIILVEMGYRAVNAQVRLIPIYAVAAAVCLSFAWTSDRVKHRYGFITFGVAVGSIGFILLLCQSALPVGAKYFALFLLVSSGYIVQPLSVAWLMNNVGGHYKRAFASAAQIGWGNAGGIVASNIFLDAEAPGFVTGYRVSLALLLMTGGMGMAMLVLLRRENRRRARGERDYLLSGPQAHNLGDDAPSYRYVY